MDGPAIGPTVLDWNEIVRAGPFDVEVQLVLQTRNRSVHFVAIGYEFDIDVDRRRAPAVQHRRRATRQVDAGRGVCFVTERLHETPDGRGIR